MDSSTLLTDFKQSLTTKGYSPRTIYSYGQWLKTFFNYLAQKNLTPFTVRYEILLAYLQQEKEKGNQVKTINIKLGSIKLFYHNLLAEEKDFIPQPLLVKIIHDIDQLKLRGGTRFILYDILSEAKLAAIYKDCPAKNVPQIRNKCLLGILIYQGLNLGQIRRLQVKDLQLEAAKVYIMGSKRNNERTLSLHPQQILLLHNYLLNIRPVLLPPSSGGATKQLFCNPSGSKNNLNNSLAKLMNKLKKIHPQLQSIRQLHRSVIHHWLKKDNIRVVQYKLGHRYLSSTQRYLQDDIDSLQQQINHLHPLTNHPT